MKIINYIKQNSLASWISFAYVTLGGIVACSLYPDDPLNGGWWFWGWLITLPVNIISFAYRSTASQNYFPVLVIQLIMLIPTFIIVSRLIAKRNKNRST
jgi:hypothetical protein